MKRIICALLSGMLLLSAVSGCTGDGKDPATEPETTVAGESAESDPDTAPMGEDTAESEPVTEDMTEAVTEAVTTEPDPVDLTIAENGRFYYDLVGADVDTNQI